jgi:outer membrane protein OmpA-like peptidoglycan-associated protein
MRGKIATVFVCLALAGCGTVHDFVYGPPTTFIVFFQEKSTDLSPDAMSIVKSAADAVRKQHPATVAIAAGVASNMELSQPRFAAVRKALIDDGMPEDLIARSAIADPKLDTGTARQRVEIRLLMKGP